MRVTYTFVSHGQRSAWFSTNGIPNASPPGDRCGSCNGSGATFTSGDAAQSGSDDEPRTSEVHTLTG